MIRLSVTDVDGYLYWRESDDGLDALLARLRKQEEPSQQMLAGRAFHKLFETAEPGDIVAREMDGFTFHFQIDSALALPVVRELKGEIVLQTHVGAVTLVGKVDALDGTTINDYKLTERFDAERYADSFQWRAYLLMFGASTFVYDVFQGRYDGARVTIYDYHRMQFHAYPGMRGHVQREVSALAEIIAKHLPEKIISEAA